MAKKTIRSYNSYKYAELWAILEWKNGYIWKTESHGYIDKNDEVRFSDGQFTLSSISTNLTKDIDCTLDPYLSDDPDINIDELED